MDQANILTKAGGLAAACLSKLWHSTLDTLLITPDMSVDCTLPTFQQPCIYVFWHEYIFAPIGVWGGCNISMLVSRHRDAHLLSRVAGHLGFGVVRGSTTRGGLSALRKMIRLGKVSNLTITPDGPQGPRRKMAPGAIYLASRLQMPLVLVGIGFDRPKRLATWDRFAIPRPFSRCRIVASTPISLPQKLSKVGIESYRSQGEQQLQQLTHQAETWAASNTHYPNQRPPRFWAPGRARRIEKATTQAGEFAGELQVEATPSTDRFAA